MSYYRVHAAHEAPETILREERWASRAWVGDYEKRCPAKCHDGEVYSDDGERMVRCEECRGRGYVEDVRRGVSVCASLDDLRAYLAQREWSRDCVVLELEGELSEDEDHDAAGGALLILPTRIVAVHPVDVLA